MTRPPARTTPPHVAWSALFLAAHWAYAVLVLIPWLLARRPRSAPRRPPAGAGREPPPAEPAVAEIPGGPVPGVAEFDRLALLYDMVSWPLTAPLFAAARDAIEPLLSPDAHVLDLACGPGRDLRSLAHLVPRGRVVGVDLAPGMLSLARRRLRRSGYSNWALLRADAAALPAELQGRFDLVHCSLAHHHLQRPERVAAEVLRCLRPGGAYAIVDTVEPWITDRLAPRRPGLSALLLAGRARRPVARRGFRIGRGRSVGARPRGRARPRPGVYGRRPPMSASSRHFQ